MTAVDPINPDDEYCVYCHAPAAGMCAECGALCCGDCVELVMGWTTQRAVCDSCIEKREDQGEPLISNYQVMLFVGTAILTLAVLLWRS